MLGPGEVPKDIPLTSVDEKLNHDANKTGSESDDNIGSSFFVWLFCFLISISLH